MITHHAIDTALNEYLVQRQLLASYYLSSGLRCGSLSTTGSISICDLNKLAI